jgi:DNA-binding MarR family transcriptional regulator
VLAALSLKGPTPIRELAELLGLERTTLTRSVALLERKGWIQSGHSDDARERPLAVTASGQLTIESAFPAWLDAQRIVGAG